jgi:hypothetical protein
MDYALFWQLVDSTRGQPDRAERLAEALSRHTPDEIIRFRLVYDDVMHAANHVDLRGAAHTINGASSDDDFYAFRERLIEMGQVVFEAAIKDPNSLADVAAPGEQLVGSEGLDQAATAAWTAVSGQKEEAFYEAVDQADTRTDRGDPEEGEWWEFDDKAEVRHRLPRLAAKFIPDQEG